MATQDPAAKRSGPGQDSLEREEGRLWRWAMLLLVLFATASAILSWDQLKNLPFRLWAIPIGLIVLSILFAVYAFGRRREASELRNLLKDLQDRTSAVPTDEQLDQISQMIRRSQRNFKELIDSLDDAAIALSLDGTLRTVNRRVSEILGIPYAEIVGHKLQEFITGDLRTETDTTWARFLETRHWSGVIEVQLKHVAKPRFYECVVNAIAKGDEVVGASVLARDVTEQRDKERRFTQLFETLQEGVYFCTPLGKLLDVNPALVEMLGYGTKDELLALPPDALNATPGDPVLGRGGSESGRTRTREIRLKRKDRTIAVFVDSSTGVIDDGRIVRYQGTLVDVTEKRAMERQLRRQEEFRRHLLESFPDLILVVDMDGRYSFIGSRIREILGYEPDQFLGKKMTELGHTPPELIALYRDVSSGEKSLAAVEYSARHKDGSWRTMRARASALLDAEGKPAGVIISVYDITTEKKLEQQIIQSERLAAMGQMIGGFAHELNNPLTSILGMTELLEDGESSESNKKQLNILHQQARRAAEIVQNLQYFARPPAPGRSSVDLNELVQRTLHLQAYPLRKGNVTVDFLQESNLPAVTADPNQLMQVFLNLILNAEQAIRENRDKGTIRIRTGRNPDTVWVTFQDDGPGIPPENLPHIFDPFFTTKRPGRGTGLGLSICKTVLREHGGNIDAGTAPGGGAVFTITLPVGGGGGEVSVTSER